MLVFSALLLPRVTRGCTDDPFFVDAYDWTCRDYDRATEQCSTAHLFADADGFHAGHKCCACRRRLVEELTPEFREAVIEPRRRQTGLSQCFASCSSGASGCTNDCEVTRNNCRDKCTSVEITCQNTCQNNYDDNIADNIIDGPSNFPSNRPDDQPGGGLEAWVIALIIVFVLLCCCLSAVAFYYYALPIISPKRVVAGGAPGTPAYSPAAAAPARGSCNAPQDDDYDNVPMLINSPYNAPPGMQRLTNYNSPPPNASCGPAPGYGY